MTKIPPLGVQIFDFELMYFYFGYLQFFRSQYVHGSNIVLILLIEKYGSVMYLLCCYLIPALDQWKHLISLFPQSGLSHEEFQSTVVMLFSIDQSMTFEKCLCERKTNRVEPYVRCAHLLKGSVLLCEVPRLSPIAIPPILANS